MRKMSKKLYVALAVVLCIGIAFVVCITPSDASDGKIPKQVIQQNTPEEVSQQKEKSEDYRQDNGEEVVLVSESEKSAQTADKVKKTPPKDTEKEVVLLCCALSVLFPESLTTSFSVSFGGVFLTLSAV